MSRNGALLTVMRISWHCAQKKIRVRIPMPLSDLGRECIQ